MARFNQPQAQASLTTNAEGAPAYTKSPKVEVATLLLCSFVQDQFYRTADEQLGRLVPLVQAAGKEFSAKAAVYARHIFGMRSITHAMAAEVAKASEHEPWLRDFFTAVVRRPDDITEILSYYIDRYGVGSPKRFRKVPLSFVRGLAGAFDKFDAYQLAKYRSEGKAVTLADAMNLLHPTPTERNRDALERLAKGTLRSSETWEAKLSAAGQVAVSEGAEREQAVEMAKGQAWSDLLTQEKLAPLALLRNLRNIVEQAPGMLEVALEQLTDPERIAKSHILPFQYAAAYVETAGPGPHAPALRAALSKAATIACKNVPRYSGRTLVALDMSGSMSGSFFSKASYKSPYATGALFASVLVEAWQADLLLFSNSAKWAMWTPGTPLLVAWDALMNGFEGGGTNYRPIFETGRPYDRIVILSDGEAWVGNTISNKFLQAYRKQMAVDPQVFWFDLQGGKTMQFPEHNTFIVSGFSERVFDLLDRLSQDPEALVKTIEAVNFSDYRKK